MLIKLNEFKVPYHPKPLLGTVNVPGSKSITNRLLLLAALTDGDVLLKGIQRGDDACHFISCLNQLGVLCEGEGEDILVHGKGGVFPREAVLDVGSGGTGARFLTAVLALSDGTYRIDCSEQMKKRPMDQLFIALRKLGAGIDCVSEEGHLPAVIHGGRPVEKLRAEVDTDVSTQFLSALLLSSPLLTGGIDIHVTGARQMGSYVGITMSCLKMFGIKSCFDRESSLYYVNSGNNNIVNPKIVSCEPDVSAACYFYAAAALTGGSVTVRGCKPDSVQGDMKFITDVLVPMGCSLSEEKEGLTVTGPNQGSLKAVDVDMQDYSDQALTLAAIAPWADGPVYIRNISHIRKQECDRVDAIKDCLERAGVRTEVIGDDVVIYPGETKPCRIDTRNDHRVAMAMSLLGLRTDGIIIEDPECCKKTFPDYFKVLSSFLAQG